MRQAHSQSPCGSGQFTPTWGRTIPVDDRESRGRGSQPWSWRSSSCFGPLPRCISWWYLRSPAISVDISTRLFRACEYRVSRLVLSALPERMSWVLTSPSILSSGLLRGRPAVVLDVSQGLCIHQTTMFPVKACSSMQSSNDSLPYRTSYVRSTGCSNTGSSGICHTQSMM